MKMNKTSKPNLKKKKNADHAYTISYINVRDLRFNFREVELHLLQFKPDFLLLSETDINISNTIEELTVPSYSLLIGKHDHLNRHGLGTLHQGRFSS